MTLGVAAAAAAAGAGGGGGGGGAASTASAAGEGSALAATAEEPNETRTSYICEGSQSSRSQFSLLLQKKKKKKDGKSMRSASPPLRSLNRGVPPSTFPPSGTSSSSMTPAAGAGTCTEVCGVQRDSRQFRGGASQFSRVEGLAVLYLVRLDLTHDFILCD